LNLLPGSLPIVFPSPSSRYLLRKRILVASSTQLAAPFPLFTEFFDPWRIPVGSFFLFTKAVSSSPSLVSLISFPLDPLGLCSRCSSNIPPLQFLTLSTSCFTLCTFSLAVFTFPFLPAPILPALVSLGYGSVLLFSYGPPQQIDFAAAL